jgi:hypothetical protein
MADEEPKNAVAKPKADEEVATETAPVEDSSEPDKGSTETASPEDAPEETPEPEPATDAPAPESPAAETTAEPDEPDPDAYVPVDPLAGMTTEEIEELRDNEVAFSWQASEYVHHHKGMGWYAGMFGGLAVILVIIALLRDWITIGAFLVMGAALFIYARKPPRTLMYELTPKGITIEGKPHLFTEFRSFGVLKEEEWHTIDLEPIKRFSPRLNILFDPDDFDSIVSHLELHLPRTDRDPDVIERLTRYLRF